jgi:hypothetical protein
VLARHQTEIARHLYRSTKARVIQRGDVGARGNRLDARQRRQAADDRVLDHLGRESLICFGQLHIQ